MEKIVSCTVWAFWLFVACWGQNAQKSTHSDDVHVTIIRAAIKVEAMLSLPDGTSQKFGSTITLAFDEPMEMHLEQLIDVIDRLFSDVLTSALFDALSSFTEQASSCVGSHWEPLFGVGIWKDEVLWYPPCARILDQDYTYQP